MIKLELIFKDKLESDLLNDRDGDLLTIYKYPLRKEYLIIKNEPYQEYDDWYDEKVFYIGNKNDCIKELRELLNGKRFSHCKYFKENKELILKLFKEEFES